MSFCRWSSDDWKCDLYAYESDEGFVVHVAANRYIERIPHLPSVQKTPMTKWMKAYRAQMKAVRGAHSEKIGGTFDGQTLVYPSLKTMLEGILLLRTSGYNVPEFVISNIESELEAHSSQPE